MNKILIPKFYKVLPAVTLAGFLIFAGCQQKQKIGSERLTGCAGKSTVAAAVAALKAVNPSISPLRASGMCEADFSSKGQAGFKETFPVRMWYAPDDRLTMLGEILFDPQSLCFAVAKQEFWTYSKHLDVCYYGKNVGVKRMAGSDLLNIRPQILLEVVDPTKAITGEAKIRTYGPFDELSSVDSDGVITKVFIDKCSYLVRRIEYDDFSGAVFFSVELRDYSPVKGGKGYQFPQKMIIQCYNNSGNGRLEISFGQVQVWQPKPQQMKVLFTRPDTKSFGHVYKITPEGKFINESRHKGIDNDKRASGGKN